MALFSSSSSNDDSSLAPEGSGQVPQDPSATENTHEMPPEEEWENKMQQLSEFNYGNANEGVEEDADEEDEESLFVRQDDETLDDYLTNNDASSDRGQQDTDGESPDDSTPGPFDVRIPEHQVEQENNTDQTLLGAMSADDQDEFGDFEADTDLELGEEDHSSGTRPKKRKRSIPIDHRSTAKSVNPDDGYTQSLDEELVREYLEMNSKCLEMREMESAGKINFAQKLELGQLEAKAFELTQRLGFQRILSGDTIDAVSTTVAGEPTGEQQAKKRRKPARNAAEAHGRRLEAIEAKEANRNARKQLTNNKGGTSKNRKPSNRNSNGTIAQQSNSLLFDLLQFRDVIKDSNNATGPTVDLGVRAKTKQSQMAQLLSNVPAEYSIHHSANDKKQIEEAAKRFGFNRVKASDGRWVVKGMNTPLYSHQLIGADWMLAREFARAPPCGGILADDMGLGKTVVMLAVLAANPPSNKDIAGGQKTTLIIVPATVVSQWISEIKKHLDKKVAGRVMHYKASKKLEDWMYEEADIMVTSFAEVMKAFVPEAGDDASFEDEVAQRRFQSRSDQSTGLFDRKFFRIILDEAHAIKNYKSRTSAACCALDSKYRWALTGTPMQNSVKEFYPYLKFLRTKWTNSASEFEKRFSNTNDPRTLSKLNIMASTMMIRRTYADRFLGRPLVNLPEAHPDIQLLTLSAKERAIYDLLEKRFRDSLNRAMARGIAAKNKQVYLVYLMRLRQATCHPFLLEEMMRKDFTIAEVRGLRRSLSLISGKSSDRDRIQDIYQIRDSDDLTTFVPDIFPSQADQDATDEGSLMERQLERLETLMTLEMMQCKVCKENAKTPYQIIECQHVFCKLCLDEIIEDEGERSIQLSLCPYCHQECSGFEPFETPASDLFHDSTESRSREEKRRIRKRHRDSQTRKESALSAPGEDANGISLSRKRRSSFLDACDEDKREPLLMSTKTRAVSKIVKQWQSEEPGDKIIIFTQFTLCAKVLGRMLNAEKIRFLYYNGDMSIPERDEAVRNFEQEDTIKVMIVGLKCGSTSLNLMWANRVISVDLYWNHSVEQQAFGRVLRLGQEKETYFVRLVTDDTIDERILAMQERKMKGIEAALQDDGRVTKSLSLEEVAELFGITEHDM